jgi:hypothetical protein
MQRSSALAKDFLSPAEQGLFLPRMTQLGQLIEASPKSMRWQLRARIGEATRWYEVPEEV